MDIKSDWLHDSMFVNDWDLSSQYYIGLFDIGRNQALICVKQLSELNLYASVNVDIYELTDEIVSNYNIIVLINSTHDKIVQILNFCHSGDMKLVV